MLDILIKLLTIWILDIILRIRSQFRLIELLRNDICLVLIIIPK